MCKAFSEERWGNRMANQDFEHFGEELRKIIQDAVEYGNYDRLNQAVTRTVNQVTERINKTVHNATGYTYQQGTYQQQSYQQGMYQQQPAKNKVKTGTKAGATLQTVFGYGLSILGAFFLMSLFVAIAQAEVTVGIIIAFMTAIAGGSGLALATQGTQTLKQIQRFQLYLQEVGSAEVCNIDNLSRKVNKSNAFVAKDVEAMIRRGWFAEGHLDEQKTCLMLTNKMYQEYLQLQQEKAIYQREEEQKQKEIQSKRNGLSSEVQKVIDQGDAYVKQIRDCNDRIPGEEISEKIARIEILVERIFDRVEENPSSVSDIRKLMDYYLPTTVKLLEAYAQMDAQPIQGDNIQASKKEIEATLDTLNVAFEKLLDDLFQDTAWDVSSDISVLNTMLAQEGLKEDQLKK